MLSLTLLRRLRRLRYRLQDTLHSDSNSNDLLLKQTIHDSEFEGIKIITIDNRLLSDSQSQSDFYIFSDITIMHLCFQLMSQ